MASNKFNLFFILSILLLLILIWLFYIKYFDNGIKEDLITICKQNEQNEQIEPMEPIDVTDVILESEQETQKPIEESIENEIEMIMYFNENDIITLAKVLYNECRGIPSDMEKACVGWIACNRVDAEFGNTIYDVLTAPNQFAYWDNTPITEELYDLATDVLTRWNNEKNGIENVGRVLQSDYLWFRGDGKHNYFRNNFSGKYDIWDYSLDNPYDN